MLINNIDFTIECKHKQIIGIINQAKTELGMRFFLSSPLLGFSFLSFMSCTDKIDHSAPITDGVDLSIVQNRPNIIFIIIAVR